MTTATNTKAAKMSEIFDISFESDKPDIPKNDGNTPFTERCDDLAATMPQETDVVPSDTEVIQQAINKDEDLEIPGDVSEVEIDADIAAASKKTDEEKIQAILGTVSDKTPQPQTEVAAEPEQVPIEQSSVISDLNLDGSDLKLFNIMKEKHPEFCLYDGSVAYQDFYRWKILALRNILSSFPILDLVDLSEEVRNIDVKHFVSGDFISPDLIMVKLGATYRERTRLNSLLITAIEQAPVWKRFLEMLKSKLWRDHEVKGAHNRDSMVLEHLYDIERYVRELEGFIESAKHTDNMLKAASDTLSRQLTCIQLKENLGMGSKIGNIPRSVECVTQADPRLDGLDEVATGTVISPPKPTNTVSPLVYGQEDELSGLGV